MIPKRSLTGDPITDAIVPIAVQLSWSVRTQEYSEVLDSLRDAQRALVEVKAQDTSETGALRALVIVLAAMIPDDRSPSDMLMWLANPDEYMELRHDGYAAGTAASIAAERVRHAA